MNISLAQIIPLPLRDKLEQRQSDIWGKAVEWQQGQWVKIKAPSGTGKTTLTHIIWQLRNDYTGTISYDGKNAATLTANELAAYRQQQMSVIFQDMRLFGNLTARENIELKRIMTGKPLYEASKIDEMAEKLGVQHVLQQKASTCSYGEQQRVAIIRALMQPFNWLIMDEPFSHLDHANASKAAALIAEECTLRKAGFILTDLDEDSFFNYSHKMQL